MHDVLRPRRTQQRLKLCAQFGWRLKASIGGEIVFEEPVARTRDVTADGIERLVFPSKPVGAASIDDEAVCLSDPAEHEFRIDGHRANGAVKVAGCDVTGSLASSHAFQPPSKTAPLL